MRIKYSIFVLLFICCVNGIVAQEKVAIASGQTNSSKPKLVVGLVIDQMRWDFLYRYADQYSANGFKRLSGEGFSCENTLISHLPTYTACGHSGIYTGSVPAITGIIGNYWFDKSTGKSVYCSEDSTVKGVGSNNAAGKMSPRNMWATSITDELRLSNNFQSKVIGISLKDRGGIFPAGHSANAAYWFDDEGGNWISSTYYMNMLPQWVNAFNERKIPAAFMKQDWNTLLPVKEYVQSTADAVPFEAAIPGEKTNAFPHRLSEIKEQQFLAFRYTPFANTFTLDFAKNAIENEKLGTGSVTDFLAVSLSSPDYAGHEFGPNSIEIQDMYLRLDRDIAVLLDFLDNKFGKDSYLFFLTADHGVAHVPAFLEANKMQAGSFNVYSLVTQINDSIEKQFGFKGAVLKYDNHQLYLNLEDMARKGLDERMIKKSVIAMLKRLPFTLQVFETDKLFETNLPQSIKEMFANGFNPKRSGDIQLTYKPGYMDRGGTGTTHGQWNPYDTHIPLLWYGWGINKGKTHREIHMTDIAPTLAALLQIQMPNGCVGKVITEIIR